MVKSKNCVRRNIIHTKLFLYCSLCNAVLSEGFEDNKTGDLTQNFRVNLSLLWDRDVIIRLVERSLALSTVTVYQEVVVGPQGSVRGRVVFVYHQFICGFRFSLLILMGNALVAMKNEQGFFLFVVLIGFKWYW